MGNKRGFLSKLFAFLIAFCISTGVVSFPAEATTEAREYEVVGKIVSDGPIFDDKNSIDITKGYYSFNPTGDWRFFSFESADGSTKYQYFLEKDNIYRLVVNSSGIETTYHASDAGILDKDGTPVGTVFEADGCQIDFSNLIFIKSGERFPTGIYEAAGTNSLGADHILVTVYGFVTDINFYKDGKLIGNLGGNYTGIDAAGTTTYKHDYEGIFNAELTGNGRLYGGRISEDKTKVEEFDLQLKPANTIKSGTYSAKGDFSERVDEIRISSNDMNFNVELMKSGNVVKIFEVALHEVKLDGTLEFVSYGANGVLVTSFEIAPDGTVRGMIYDDYNMELNYLLTKIN